MSKSRLLAAAAASAFVSMTTFAAPTIAPLVGFGGPDGWLAPGEGGYTFLGTANLERGLAYNPASGNLILASRFSGANNLRILNGSTGADLGALINTGITGGTFAINQLAADASGIYVGNLATGPTAYKIYKWSNELATPATVFSGVPLAGARVGDSLDLVTSGASTYAVAGYGNTPAVAGNNGYTIVDVGAGTSTSIAFTGSPPAAGDFRLGVTFGATANDVIGTQGTVTRVTSYSGTTGTLAGSFNPFSTAERNMDYAVIAGVPFLAMQSTGDSHLSVYDMTNPLVPVLVASGLNVTGALTANGNGSGQVKFGAISGDTATIYAMSTNQGIQAFTFVVPEPASLSLIGLGAIGMLRRRK